MRGKRNNENKDAARNSHTKFSRKQFVVTAAVVATTAIIVITMVYLPLLTTGSATPAQAQDASLGQVLRSISPINVQATVVKDKVTNVNGIALTEVSTRTTSMTTEDVNGTIKSVFKNGLAEIAILKGSNTVTGNDTIAFRITNIGKDSFKIVTLGLEGQTKSGFSPMQVLAVSEKNFDTPIVNIRDAVLLNPGESMTGYIIGKWRATGINEDITEFQAGAVYRYENTDGSVKVWSITTDLYSLT